MNINLDTNTLIAAGLLKPNLSDLRVVRYNTGTGVYTELDRVYLTRTDCLGLWFATIDAIPANSVNDNYYIYYNNPAAVNPPANPNNVFIWYDTFITNTTANYDHGRFLDMHGTGADNMTYDNVNKRMSFNTGDNVEAGLRIKHTDEVNALMQCDAGITGVYPTSGTLALSCRWRNAHKNILAHISNSDYPSPQIGTDGTRNSDIVDPPGNFYFPANGSVHTFRFAVGHSYDWGGLTKSDIFFWVDNILRASALGNTTYPNQDGRIIFEAAQQQGWLDNILVRLFISPEPTVTILQEGNTTINGTVCASGDIILVGSNITINNASETYPSLITKSGIYFNGVDSGVLTRPEITGLMYAAGNINIENIQLLGGIYGYNISVKGNVSIQYNTNPLENPFINSPPYFSTTASAIIKIKWMNARF